MSKKQENTVSVEEFEKLKVELEALQASGVNLENQLKRAVADYHNLEKRVSEGRSELTNYVGAEIIKKLIPTLDHLEQALEGASEQERKSGWFKGVEMATRELNQVLTSEGLEQIEAEGQFDPNLHEAVDTQEGEDNMILKVVRKGYNLNAKVIRPAQVIVGRRQDNHPEEAQASEGSREENI